MDTGSARAGRANARTDDTRTRTGEPNARASRANARAGGSDHRLLKALGGVLLALILLGVWQVRGLSVTDECGRPDTLNVVGSKDDSGMRNAVISGWPGHENLRANFQELPESTDQEHSEEVAIARSGGCAADVYILDLPWIPEFAEAGYIAEVDIPEKDLRPVIKKIRETGRYEDRLWAVPLNTDAPLLYYRKDLVTAPVENWARSWAALRRQAEVQAPALGAGLTLQLAGYEGFVVNVLELIRAYNGDISVGRSGKVSLNRGAVLAALRDLAGGMRGSPPAISPSALRTDEHLSREAFKNGQVVFMRNWPSSYALIANSGTLKPEQIGVEPYPGSGSLGGQSMAIASGLPDERAKAARELIKYLTAKPQQEQLFACGGFAPVREDVYSSGAAVKCAGLAGRQQDVVLHAPADKMLQAVRAARPRPSLPYYPEFSRVLQTRLRGHLECMVTKPSCQAAKHFLDDLDEALRKAAAGKGAG